MNDPENVFTPELLSMLQSWPASDHARSGLHRDRFSIRLAHGSLLFTTENQWGEAVTSHQLRVFSAVLDRLVADVVASGFDLRRLVEVVEAAR